MVFGTLALKGARRYRKQRKNLTFVLVGSFFLLSFFVCLFSSIFYYLESYWAGHLLGYEVVRPLKKEKVSGAFHIPPRKEDLFSVQEILPILHKKGVLASPRLRFGAMLEPDVPELETGSSSKVPLMIVGIDAERESQILKGLTLEWGKWPTRAGEILLFGDLYEQLHPSSFKEQKEQDLKLILYTSTLEGYFNYDLVTVVGVVNPRDLQFFYGSSWVGFVDRSYATTLIEVPETTASEIIMKKLSWPHRWILSTELPRGYERVEFWQMEDIPYTSRWFYWFLAMLLSLLILGIVLATVSHNIRLLVVSRTKEIGVFLAMGASPLWVMGLFIAELVLYGAYCGILGGILNGILIFSLNSIGIYAINAPMELFLGTGTFYFRISPLQYMVSFLVFEGVLIGAAFFPLIRGIRKVDVISLFRR